MVKLQVNLDHAEADALLQLARRELREPREQVRAILRRELQHQGLLDCDKEAEQGEGVADAE
jgi:hypothetical protein